MTPAGPPAADCAVGSDNSATPPPAEAAAKEEAEGGPPNNPQGPLAAPEGAPGGGELPAASAAAASDMRDSAAVDTPHADAAAPPPPAAPAVPDAAAAAAAAAAETAAAVPPGPPATAPAEATPTPAVAAATAAAAAPVAAAPATTAPVPPAPAAPAAPAASSSVAAEAPAVSAAAAAVGAPGAAADAAAPAAAAALAAAPAAAAAVGPPLASPAATAAAAAAAAAAAGAVPPALSASLHGFGCCRGELLLTDGERRSLEQYLAAVSVGPGGGPGGSSSGGPWRMVMVPDSASVVGRKARKGSAVKRSAAASAVGASSAGPPASYDRQRRQSVASHQAAPTSHQAELPKTRSTRARSAPQSFCSEGGEGGPPDSQGGPPGVPSPGDAADWPRRMQRILLELCKQPVCLPFLPRVSPSESHYAELARKVYPAVPLSLETVLERLENGEYSRSLEVFNDVYSVFMCAFRYYEPGNQYWMMAQEASLAFGALTMGEPLCNAFAPASASHDAASQEWGRAGDEAWESGAKGGKTRGAGKTAGKTRPTRAMETGGGSGKLKARGPRAPAQQQAASGNAPVTVEERQAFQELLTQMSMDAHFQLYNTFKERAKWVSFDTGEVELDDGATLPFVFREMVQWCRQQVFQGQGQAAVTPQQAYAAPAAQLPQSSADGQNGVGGPPAKKMKMSEDSDSSESSDDLSDDDF